MIQSKIPNVPPSVKKAKQGLKGLPKGFYPVVDGVVLQHHPFDPKAPKISRNKPLMVGWNKDEYTDFLN